MQNKSFGKNIIKGFRLRIGKLFYNPYHIVNIGTLKKIYLKHLNPGKVRWHKMFGKKLCYRNPSEFLHGLNEIFIEEIYNQTLPPHANIIDCGANIGLSVIYMKRLYPDAAIVAFEPDEENFKLLKRNINEFGFDQVELKKEAIWTENKILNFSGKGSTESKVSENESGGELVQATRLKDLLNKKVDFLKIDIEGAEYKVIVDLQEKLSFVDNLFLEYHGNFDQNGELNEIFSIIVNNGFSYYIKEAASVYSSPFLKSKHGNSLYDIQLNIFCFRNSIPHLVQNKIEK